MSEPRSKSNSSASDYAHAQELLLASILRGDEAVANRTTLGPRIPIQLFQSLRLVALGSAMEEMVGEGARALVYRSGQRLGAVLGNAVVGLAQSDLKKYLGLLHEVAKKLSIGVIIPEKVDTTEGKLVIRVDECVSCAGISGASAPMCQFEAGMVGGLVRAFTGSDVRAIETRCNAVGDKTCGIDVNLYP